MPRWSRGFFVDYSSMKTFLFFAFLCGLSLAQEVTFMAYNLKNFLETDIYKNGELTGTRYKPEKEIRALIDVITEANPDILGICEIGGENDLVKLKELLAARGVYYPHTEHVDAADSVRHLALLSKHPLKSKSYTTLTYSIGEKKFPLRRGLLYTEILINGQTFHALGIHLKSKRPTEYADQATMRQKEALLVRQQADQILSQTSDAKLFLYGDFNDTFKSPTLNTLKGSYRSPKRLEPLDLQAPNGNFWTYYWAHERVYSTFDYILCSKAMLDHVIFTESGILSSEKVNAASDHRPLVMKFTLWAYISTFHLNPLFTLANSSNKATSNSN